MTVKEVSRITGISIRTLQHYDHIGLLPPAQRTQAGYRLYDENCLGRLQDILLLRELEFSLKEIRDILDSPGYDRKQAIRQQIALLERKRQRLDGIIALARGIETMEELPMNFSAFDQDYAKEAKKPGAPPTLTGSTKKKPKAALPRPRRPWARD